MGSFYSCAEYMARNVAVDFQLRLKHNLLMIDYLAEVENETLVHKGKWVEEKDRLMFRSCFEMACIYSKDEQKYKDWVVKTVLVGNCGEMLDCIDKYDTEKVERLETISTFISATAEVEDLDKVIDFLGKTLPLYESSYDEYVSKIVFTINDLIVQLRNDSGSKSVERLNECVNKLEKIYEKDQYRTYPKEHLLRTIATTGTDSATDFIEKHIAYGESDLHGELKLILGDCKNIPAEFTKREVVESTESTTEEVFLYDKTLEECIDKVLEIRNELIRSGADLSEEVRKILELRIFNMLNRGETVDLDTELQKVKTWLANEEKCKNNKYLPPVGGELEVPRTDKDEYKTMLNWFGIKTYDESGNLLEIQERPTYSVGLLNRLLQEVAMTGLIDLQEIDASDGVFFKDEMSEKILSFHLNFGVPKSLCEKYTHLNETLPELMKIKFKDNITSLMGMLTFAFVSSDRAEKKKNNISWDVKSTDMVETDKNGKMRLELRMSEFRDFPTYRMSEETQDLVSAIFAKMQIDEGLGDSDPVLSQLSSIWEYAEEQFLTIMKEESIVDLDDMLNSNKHTTDRLKLVYSLKNQRLVEKSRNLFDTTARFIRELYANSAS